LRVALDRLKDLETIPFQAPPVVTQAIARAKPISEPLSGTGESETLQRVTVNIGTIEGGTSPNLVPTHAIARPTSACRSASRPTCWRRDSTTGWRGWKA
jgi:hypothetical protein